MEDSKLLEYGFEIVSGLISLTIGIAITVRINRRQEKRREAFNMFKEFKSEDMKNNANLAYKLILKHPNKNYDIISNELPPNETNPLWTLIGFYQYLWILIDEKQINRRLVPRLFGELIVWWYYFSFKENLLPVDWDTSKDIKKLFNWIKKNSKSKDFQNWKRQIELRQSKRIVQDD